MRTFLGESLGKLYFRIVFRYNISKMCNKDDEMLFSPGMRVRIRDAEWFIRHVAPSGMPIQRAIVCKAPFFRKDREADYKEAWEMLERRHS